MRIFVTGATGFVGSHFARLSLAQGHEVLAVRRANGAARCGLEAVHWSSTALNAIGPLDLLGCNALVLFAAAGVSPQIATVAEMRQCNVEATRSLLKAAAACGVRRVVVAGSAAEYGSSADDHDFIPPDASLRPSSLYGMSKAECFYVCKELATQLGLELAYLRIFSAFGEGQFPTNFWPALKLAAQAGEDFLMTAGGQIRDFTSVQAVAEQFLAAVVNNHFSSGELCVANVGSGKPEALVDFACRWWSAWRARGELRIGALPYRSDESMRVVPLLSNDFFSTQPAQPVATSASKSKCVLIADPAN